MGLSGIQIFKLTPKKNCKKCGCQTCMAFAMKVSQGILELSKCVYMSKESLNKLSEATAPLMKTIKIKNNNNEFILGGETVLFRHEKTFVNKTRYAIFLCTSMSNEIIDSKLLQMSKINYERINEKMFVEMIYVNLKNKNDEQKYIDIIKKVLRYKRVLILNCTNINILNKVLNICKENYGLILNGVNLSNYTEMNNIANKTNAILGVSGKNLSELYDVISSLEKLGNKKLILDITAKSISRTYCNSIQIRRAALKDQDRIFGYPVLINLFNISNHDRNLQQALAALFTVKYGSIIVLEYFDYSEALPLFGLRQNLFTDPQKPMKVEPGIYPLNGANENSICLTTVDFALTYFIVSGELERSGIPCNLIITDAGGLSVLTAWASGKLSSSSISKYIKENVESKIKCRKLIIPGKVAILKGDIEAKLPNWKIIVAPLEAIQLIKFLKSIS